MQPGQHTMLPLRIHHKTTRYQKAVSGVVEAATIVADGLELFVQKIEKGMEMDTGLQDEKMHNLVDTLKGVDKYELIKQVLVPEDYNLIVTPKEIDDLIENMKDVVARGINFSF